MLHIGFIDPELRNNPQEGEGNWRGRTRYLKFANISAAYSFFAHGIVSAIMSLASALEGLGRAFSSLSDNGVIDIGLQAALDVGVAIGDYIQVPRCCLKPLVLTQTVADGPNIEVTPVLIDNLPSVVHVGSVDPVLVHKEGGELIYSYRGEVYDTWDQGALSDQEIKRRGRTRPKGDMRGS